MNSDETSGRGRGASGRSRRALLAGAAGAAGMVAVQTLGRATPAQATQGSPVLEGQDNVGATSRTGIFTTGKSEFAILADPNTSGKGSLGVYGHGQNVGVLGDSSTGPGVQGIGGVTAAGLVGESGVSGTGGSALHGTTGGEGGAGVVGQGGAGGEQGGVGVVGTGGSDANDNRSAGVVGVGGVGVQGQGTGTGVFGIGGGTGVSGSAENDTGIGVGGIAPRLGTGVNGTANLAGAVGVVAENTAGGTAFQANGTARFSGSTVFGRSGILTVRAGSSEATKRGVALTAASLVLATLQQHRAGVHVLAAVPNVTSSSFTVFLSTAVPANTKVAWFVVN